MNRALSLAVLGIVGLVAAALAWRYRDSVRAAIVRFFTAASSPLNLAVLRIAVFGFVAWISWGAVVSGGIVRFSRLPDALVFPPRGTGWILRLLPVDPFQAGLIRTGAVVLAVSATLAAVGLGTRLAAWVAVLSGVYVLGVPQFFGKVDHSHHLLWIGAVVASAPSGDALSVDAWIRDRRRRAAGKAPERPGPSRAYGLPLRVTWLLIGCVYLFPGIHKYLADGLRWAISDNLLNRIAVHRFLVGVPPLDLSGPLEIVVQLAAAATIVFEVGFIVALFSDRVRPYAIAAAILFHVGSWFLLGIGFWHLILVYVAFVDWAALARRVRAGPAWIPPRVPETGPPRGATVATAAVVLLGVVLTGALGIVDGWPFASYPTFTGIQRPEVQAVALEIVPEDGGDGAGDEPQQLRLSELVPWLPSSRVAGMTNRVLAARNRDVRFAALWQVAHESGAVPAPDEVREVRFIREVYRVDGGPRPDRPDETEVVAILDP